MKQNKFAISYRHLYFTVALLVTPPPQHGRQLIQGQEPTPILVRLLEELRVRVRHVQSMK